MVPVAPYLDDPSEIGFPHMLPIELALRVAPVKDICQAHGLNQQEWNELRVNPSFVRAVADAVEMLKKEGMSFKIKARMQSEELLKTSWAIIHSNSDVVGTKEKVDLIKTTWRVAGLDASQDQGRNQVAGAQANNLQININLG